MSDADKRSNKGSWAIGGGVLLGLGVGFVFLHDSVLFFLGSLIAGLGLGLILAAILSD